MNSLILNEPFLLISKISGNKMSVLGGGAEFQNNFQAVRLPLRGSVDIHFKNSFYI
jgi:hypothetical protein